MYKNMIWLVSLRRFLQEYQNHIANTPNKYVNWFVDESNQILLYIEQTNGVNSYCYTHTGDTDTLPIEIKDIIQRNGEVLGIEDVDIGDEETEERINNAFTRLKYNQVGINDKPI